MRTPTPIRTPCIKLCVLDDGGFCLGCFRSRDEIAGWMQMTDQQRTSVIGVLARRRLHRRSEDSDD